MSEAKNLLGTFIWYDQMSNDLPGSELFYAKVVGWTLAPNTMNDQRYTLLQAGAAAVGGLMPIPEHAEGVPPAWMGYIAVDDVAAYADKVKAAGGAIHRGPTEIPNVGTFAVAGDPDGAGFLLFKGNSADAPAYDPTGPGHVGWRELNAGDGEKAFAFYAGLFGWTKTSDDADGPVERVSALRHQERPGRRGVHQGRRDAASVLALLLQCRGDRRRNGAGEERGRQNHQRSARGSRQPLDRSCPRSSGRPLRARCAEPVSRRAPLLPARSSGRAGVSPHNGQGDLSMDANSSSLTPARELARVDPVRLPE